MNDRLMDAVVTHDNLAGAVLPFVDYSLCW